MTAEPQYIYAVEGDRISRYEIMKETPKMFLVKPASAYCYANRFRKADGEPARTPEEAILRHKVILGNLIEKAKERIAGYEKKPTEADWVTRNVV